MTDDAEQSDEDLTTGMMTGSDAGEPGDGGGSALPLDADEQAILAELRRPGTPVVEAVEDSEAVERAIADETPLTDS